MDFARLFMPIAHANKLVQKAAQEKEEKKAENEKNKKAKNDNYENNKSKAIKYDDFIVEKKYLFKFKFFKGVTHYIDPNSGREYTYGEREFTFIKREEKEISTSDSYNPVEEHNYEKMMKDLSSKISILYFCDNQKNEYKFTGQDNIYNLDHTSHPDRNPNLVGYFVEANQQNGGKKRKSKKHQTKRKNKKRSRKARNTRK